MMFLCFDILFCYFIVFLLHFIVSIITFLRSSLLRPLRASRFSPHPYTLVLNNNATPLLIQNSLVLVPHFKSTVMT